MGEEARRSTAHEVRESRRRSTGNERWRTEHECEDSGWVVGSGGGRKVQEISARG